MHAPSYFRDWLFHSGNYGSTRKLLVTTYQNVSFASRSLSVLEQSTKSTEMDLDLENEAFFPVHTHHL